jgi:hypothetical protein
MPQIIGRSKPQTLPGYLRAKNAERKPSPPPPQRPPPNAPQPPTPEHPATGTVPEVRWVRPLSIQSTRGLFTCSI